LFSIYKILLMLYVICTISVKILPTCF